MRWGQTNNEPFFSCPVDTQGVNLLVYLRRVHQDDHPVIQHLPAVRGGQWRSKVVTFSYRSSILEMSQGADWYYRHHTVDPRVRWKFEMEGGQDQSKDLQYVRPLSVFWAYLGHLHVLSVVL